MVPGEDIYFFFLFECLLRFVKNTVATSLAGLDVTPYGPVAGTSVPTLEQSEPREEADLYPPQGTHSAS